MRIKIKDIECHTIEYYTETGTYLIMFQGEFCISVMNMNADTASDGFIHDCTLVSAVDLPPGVQERFIQDNERERDNV